jgi:prevent-host-death family protein
MRVMTATELRARLGEALNRASAGERILIERDHRPLAVLVTPEDAARLDESREERARRVDRALPLSFVVAKGGITSSDIATKGLEVRRAEVAGPLLPPAIVPVWILPDENDFPGLPYVIFPGNVGGPESLARAIEVLRGER